MKRKLFYLFSLMLLCIIGTSGALAATDVTFGLTRPLTVDATDETKGTMGSNVLQSTGDFSTLTEIHGSGVTIDGQNRTYNINNVAYTATSSYKKSVKLTTFDETQYAGFSFTVPEGKKLDLTKVDARFSDASNTAWTWKISVQDASYDAIWESASKTVSANSTTTVSLTDENDLANKLAGLRAGTYYAKIYFYQGGTTKCNTIDLEFTGSLDDDTSAPTISGDLASTANASVNVAKTFTIEANGATSYQWYKASSATADLNNDEPISGANSASYDYTATTEGTEYIYCAATNDNGTTISTVCAVTATVSSDDYSNTEATFAWAIGNESEATITGDVTDAVKSTKVKAGTDLETGTASYTDPGSGTLVTYKPGTSNAGNVAADMVEYTIKMAKGTTFTPTSVAYDAVKVGTDNATFSWSYTVDGTESDITTISKDNIVRNNNSTGTPALRHTETITGAEGGQVVTVRFYVSGFGNTKTLGLGNIAINGVVNGTVEQRSFTDFKVDFRTNPYTVVAPTTGELPSGVEVTVPSYNGSQHGAQGATTIVVPVDGPVKFTIGNCQYSSYVTVTDANNTISTNVANNGSCENSVSDIASAPYNSYVTYTYNSEEANTLTFTLHGYLPYFFAEACDYIEQCEVTYYDVDGKTALKTETVDGGSELAYNSEATAAVTVADGYAFRGWFSDAGLTAVKVPEGTPVTEDLKLYAKATEVEVAEVGKIFTYELNKQYFYQEDHETFSASNGSFHDGTHGWAFGTNGSFSVDVAGNAQVVLSLCQFGNGGAINVTNANSDDLGSIENAKVATDGATSAFNYTGEATTLTFTFTGGGYLHNVKVYNVNAIPSKDEATGYYIVPANDGASFLLALNSANAEGTSENPAKIFLPNGTYDLGNTCLTSVSSYVSIIGESQDGVIIKNAPDEEGIGVTATLLFTGQDIYLQDLSLNCSAENCATPAASRCVTIQDKGTRNIAKNVSLLSGQDTYYSNGGASQRAFFDNCYITGTVDFLCGGGDVVFNNTTLYVNARSSANVIAAPNTDATTQWGYLMLNCTIDGDAGQANKYNMARPWNGSPAATWINTTCNILPSANAYTKMSDNLVLRFHEYGTKDANGNAITGHKLDDCNGASGSDALYLTETEAANYTIANVLSGSDSWDPEAIVEQETVVKTSVVNNVVTVPEGIYLVEKDGNFVEIFNGTSYTYDNSGSYTLRKANARGGFGEAVAMVSGAAAPEVNGETITLTVSANMQGYRAYVNTESNYRVDANTKVYLPVSKTNNEVNLEVVDCEVVPANRPVVLVTTAEANADGTYTITLTTTDDASDLNSDKEYLQLTEAGVAVNGYRLGYKASSGIKFYKYVASAPEAGKIYLDLADLPEDNGNSGNYLKIAFEQEATGINEVNAVDAGSVNGKFVKNGKLIIIKNGKSYNAAGAVLE